MMVKDTSKVANFKLNKAARLAELEFVQPTCSADTIQKALDQLERELSDFNENENYDVLIIRSTKNQANSSICFHAHINDALDVRVISKWEKIVVLLERMTKVTIIALSDQVSEQMLQLSLVCDFRICAPDTQFRFTSIDSGFLPGMAVFRLTKYVGLGRAKRMLFTNEKIDALKARRITIIDKIVDDLDQEIKHICESITPHKKMAVLMARRLMYNSYHTSYEEEIGDYLAAQVRCLENLKKK